VRPAQREYYYCNAFHNTKLKYFTKQIAKAVLSVSDYHFNIGQIIAALLACSIYQIEAGSNESRQHGIFPTARSRDIDRR
jgi:hypothetical protein